MLDFGNMWGFMVVVGVGSRCYQEKGTLRQKTWYRFL